MADTEKDKVWINTLVEKELVKEFDELVQALDTDRSKLIRNLMREAIDEFRRKQRQKERLTRTINTVRSRTAARQ